MADRIDPGFGHWLAGFVDGEGCFAICKNGNGTMYCACRVALRADDEAILQEIAERTGVGRVTVGQPPSQKTPRATWYVTRKAECLQLVELFECFPLRAKKRRDFAIWARAVRDWNQRPAGWHNRWAGVPGRVGDWSGLSAYKAELEAVRRMPQGGVHNFV